MAKTRFTYTGKWFDPWFHRIGPYAKLLFLYVCENCDPAGFWEVDLDRAAFDTGIPGEAMDAVLKEISRCYERTDGWIWLRNFVEYQKNLPLNPANQAHKGILRSIERRKHLFPNVMEKIRERELQGAIEGLTSPIGIGIGKGIGKGKEITKRKTVEKAKPTPAFLTWWNKYPEHTLKSHALSRWILEVTTPEDEKLVMVALDKYLQTRSVQRGFIMRPSNWLKSWRDWLEDSTPAKRTHKNTPEVEAMLARGRAARRADGGLGTRGGGDGDGGTVPAAGGDETT